MARGTGNEAPVGQSLRVEARSVRIDAQSESRAVAAETRCLLMTTRTGFQSQTRGGSVPDEPVALRIVEGPKGPTPSAQRHPGLSMAVAAESLR